jgi:hypothetical protein
LNPRGSSKMTRRRIHPTFTAEPDVARNSQSSA